METLKEGSRGSNVRLLQKKLIEKAFQLGVDGIFGPGTTDAVIAFRRNQPDLEPDRVAGRLTWAALEGTPTITPEISDTISASETAPRSLSEDDANRAAQLCSFYFWPARSSFTEGSIAIYQLAVYAYP